MVQRRLVPWIQNPESMTYGSTGPSRPVQHKVTLASAPVVSTDRSKVFYRLALVLTVVLCCLLLNASIVLGVLYGRETKENDKLDSLLSDYQNVTRLYQGATEANVQLQRENTNLTQHNAGLERENQDLSNANAILKGEAENISKNNTQLLIQNQELMGNNSWLQEENDNLTQRNIWLEWEKHNLSDTNSLLRRWCGRVEENSTWLQKENWGLLDQNTWLQDHNQNLTHQNVWLKTEKQALMRYNARLRLEKANLLDQKQMIYLNYLALDWYCPVVKQETQERLCKKCDDNWIAFQFKCYFFSEHTKTWNASRAQCQSEGADLLIVNSVEEQRFAFRTSQSVNQRGNRVWIGLTDVQTEGEWRWVNGNLVTKELQFWHNRTFGAHEPDDWKQHNPLGEDCGHLDTSLHALTSWMDGPCESAYRWICEKSI
ncbi:hypothetical protein AGOR_G00095350 [Albula goreensis]|uniref:C-type lectin domain-containing protein n=1 Tax=Albula goreensis TaxID=1534307 RepID=A0A8T3DGS4_9TELE|nr:hypothetical protein AGOR_G00095350 [Albula goreensis]